ncbi:MAG: RHS repeat-associated core domain-containing protein [Pseudomonadota bacterium]
MSSSVHHFTPALSVIDPRGLAVRTVDYHRSLQTDELEARIEHLEYDRAGRLTGHWDTRLWAQGGEPSEPNLAMISSLSGRKLNSRSVDAGLRVGLFGDDGQNLVAWDGRGTRRQTAYDLLLRPVSVHEQMTGGIRCCVERFTYGGVCDTADNGCGRLVRHHDPAGSKAYAAYGVQGQITMQEQRFLSSLDGPDWPDAVSERDALLEIDGQGLPVTYVTQWQHDAGGSVLRQIDAVGSTHRLQYDVVGQHVQTSVQAVNQPEQLLLRAATYDAWGQVFSEVAGNNVITTALYSPIDGRLQRLTAARADKVLQDLQYQYDPVGNIVRIEDLAQPVQWFAQQRIEAVSTYRYDSLYQLVEATGRENASHISGPGLPGLEVFGAPDDSRWRNYVQAYSYDSGGNLTLLKHDAGAGNTYTRERVVAPRSNRSLIKDADTPVDFSRGFDANGNQQVLVRGQSMLWNARNQLCQVTQVVREGADGQDDDVETYVYDGAGQRVRKVRRTKTHSGEHLSEVRYLPAVEIRTCTAGERLHVTTAEAGRNSVRLLHWLQGAPTGLPVSQWRYSLSDHLNSSTLELDATAEVITQEMYYPFGGTAWWATRSEVDAKYKTVRYSGKERDATGLYYYGFRYYAPWLQLWINPDPAGQVNGLNLYRMVSNNPVGNSDAYGLYEGRGDRYEELAGRSIKIIARGRSDMAPEVASRLDSALAHADEVLTLMIDTLSSPDKNAFRTDSLDTVLKKVFGERRKNKAAFAADYTAIRDALKKYSKGGSRDQIVLIGQKSGERQEVPNGFYLKTDPHNRIFVGSDVYNAKAMRFARTLIHETSHMVLGTIDIRNSRNEASGYYGESADVEDHEDSSKPKRALKVMAEIVKLFNEDVEREQLDVSNNADSYAMASSYWGLSLKVAKDLPGQNKSAASVTHSRSRTAQRATSALCEPNPDY